MFPLSGAMRLFCNRHKRVIGLEQTSRRSRRACANGLLGSPRNLGGPVVSTYIPGRRYRVINSKSSIGVRVDGVKNNAHDRGIAERRQRSDARRTAGSHSILIVPSKRANCNPTGARGGKRDVGTLNRYWEIRQMPGHLENVSTVQQRIATLAERSADFAFFSLAHYITLDWLEAAYHRTRKDGAAGIDDVTGAMYAENLHENLRSLHERLKSGTYKAPPVRRKYIPKGTSGEARPIGIPAFEDKVVQRAVVMLLEPIYEHDFHDGSYGFRPGLGAHDALEAVWKTTMDVGGGWVLEVDLRKFFDTLDHKHLREFVSRRVRDGSLRRLIGKWLKAGVMEAGNVSYPDAGSPQGGVISPLLANIYLHYVLDEWFEQEVRPRMKGRCRLIRYADDFVIVFETKSDADRVMEVLPKRFGKYGLTVHPEKTKLVDFRNPVHWERRREESSNDEPGGGGRPETFDLLGFTHFWGKTRKGGWAVKRKTMSERLTRAVRSISQWCRGHRHLPVREQWKKLSAKVRGHYCYYGITGNIAALANFRYLVVRVWRDWLSRRNRERSLDWSKFGRLLRMHPLPYPRIVRGISRKSRRPTPSQQPEF